MLQKKIKFDTLELQRFYFDTLGLESLSLEKIQEIKNMGIEMHANLDTYYYNNREDTIKDYYARSQKYVTLTQKLGISQNWSHLYHKLINLTDFNLNGSALSLQIAAFNPIINLLGSDEQREYWLPLAHEMKITGAYVQTELGHGSDVKSLETTATYDEKTKEIVFNTPSVSSTKFWPGGLGKSATHMVVFAKLISKGQDHGIQAFILQIRDIKTHKVLPGLEVGDVGPKISQINTDNGYLIFKNFRGSKTSLLSRYVQLNDDGTFQEKIKNSGKLAFGGMLKLRVSLVDNGHRMIGRMATIATRYSFLRRQFESKDGNQAPEAMIMSYQMQQYKIVPAIAAAWSILFAGSTLFGMYDHYQSKLQTKDPKAFEILGDLHALTSGFKGISTWSGEYWGEILKQSCGGHGYLQVSGLTRPHLDFGVGVVTAEGDNTVLMQQTSAYLLKKIQKGKIDPDTYEFTLSSKLSIDQEIVLLYEVRFKNHLKNVALQIAESMSKGKNFNQIWNDEYQADLVIAGKYFISHFAIKNFYDIINGKSLNATQATVTKLSPELQKVMQMLFRVHGVYQLIEEYETFYMNYPSDQFVDYFNSKKIDDLKKQFKEELQILGMTSLDIVDGFDFKDPELLSIIGRKEVKNQEQLYEELLNVVRKNPINSKPVPLGYQEYIRPLLVGKL
ncbi:peroxisomal acyl-coenzyme a oxidase 1 [Stylonychia lemnae]|uniref:Acyl-coenzyme A oxidase n=1 Tax=Stylonychia lemnae TaxID=5949 RepID=A0A078ARA7_STYLE|nr:peroxisomal acyl-coenzyme a oxidase 1 [Stylonychia lemnae]|eukprot:CDW84516.1 peroxisomal acyl-coenzyme a oxidase 1 [Stylonychia lemnae]